MAKNDQSNSKQEQQNEKQKFSQEQYNMLKRCSEKKDMTEWNKWREENPDEEILLQKADLSEAHLEGADLSGANLKEAMLTFASLSEADLSGADLSGATVNFAVLQAANLSNANMEGANLRGAYLGGADLLEAKNLLGGQLGGTDVSNSALPPTIKDFDALDQLAERSKHAQRPFITIVVACVYLLLCIGTTTDVQIVTNSRSFQLPIIRTAVPVMHFLIIAPILLLVLFFYFHLCLERICEVLSDLPAVFPDGGALHEKAYPWILDQLGIVVCCIGVVAKPQTRVEEPRLYGFQVILSILSCWFFVPITVFCISLRSLLVSTGLNAFHAILFAVSLWYAIYFVITAVLTLLGKFPKAVTSPLALWVKSRISSRGLGGKFFVWVLRKIVRKIHNTWMWHCAGILVLAVLLNVGASHLRRLSPFGAFLYEADISTKPTNWTGKEEEIDLVKGARLAGKNLRKAMAFSAFLVKADLTNADLANACLVQADLRTANLKGADLRGALLQQAKLSFTRLDVADLRGADLSNIENWKKITSLELTNVFGVRNAPAGFVDWATKAKGAVCIESDEEWRKIREQVDLRKPWQKAVFTTARD